MTRKIKIATRLALAAVAFICLYLLSMDAPHNHSDIVPQAQAVEKGKLPAPPFSLPDLNGKMVSLADYKGKWVFVNFWATWCGPCVYELPMLVNLHKIMKGKKFEMLLINMEDIEADQVRKFVKDNKLPFTVLLDKDSKIGGYYAIQSLPTSYVISPGGEIVSRAVGMREWDSEEVVQYFKGLVSGQDQKKG